MRDLSGHRRFSYTILGVAFLFLCISCKNSTQKVYSVMKGEFVQSVTESGELQAINAVSIMMPKINQRYGYRFKLIGILEHGTMVEKGDSIAALDASAIYKYIIQQEEALDKARAFAEKQQVQSEIARRDLEVQLKNEEASFDLKKLELERMQFESDAKKKVKELEYEKAKIRLSKVKQKLALNPILDKYDKLVNDLQVSQRQSDIKSAVDVLKNMVLYSPGKGYFEINYNRNEGHNFSLGDQVSMGSMIASIPDVSHMKAKSFINEMDISKMEVGGKVAIRLDALPEIVFNGSINHISSICTEKDGQKIFITEISIEDSDSRLKPGMSVSCEYITYESEESLFVPNQCLLSEAGKAYVFVKKGRNYKKTEVKTGVSNANHTVIHTKLKPGRELLSLDTNSDI